MSVAGGGQGGGTRTGAAQAFRLAPSPAARHTPCCGGGLTQLENWDRLAGRAAGPPGRQQSLCCGLPCPSSDSSWQLWRNVLLTAVLLINGEHVCVAETFLFFFVFFCLVEIP